jgi:hypothetical protein
MKFFAIKCSLQSFSSVRVRFELRNKRKLNMKKLLFIAGLMIASLPALAADKEVTVSGKLACSACVSKTSDSCQNVLETTENGIKVSYKVAYNDVVKTSGANTCSAACDVKAVGTVKEVDGKKELTLSKLVVSK